MEAHRRSTQLGLHLPNECPAELGSRQERDLIEALAQLLTEAAVRPASEVSEAEVADDE
jgi:hypothetical protein